MGKLKGYKPTPFMLPLKDRLEKPKEDGNAGTEE